MLGEAITKDGRIFAIDVACFPNLVVFALKKQLLNSRQHYRHIAFE